MPDGDLCLTAVFAVHVGIAGGGVICETDIIRETDITRETDIIRLYEESPVAALLVLGDGPR